MTKFYCRVTSPWGGRAGNYWMTTGIIALYLNDGWKVLVIG